METPYNVEVEYRKPIRGGHMVKVSFHDFGMYIDGWRVTPSDKNPKGWWFQSPARTHNGNFIAMIEFAKSEFFDWLENEAIRVVKAQEEPNGISPQTTPPESPVNGLDTVYIPTDEEIKPENISQAMNDELDLLGFGNIDVPPKPKPPVDPWRNS